MKASTRFAAVNHNDPIPVSAIGKFLHGIAQYILHIEYYMWCTGVLHVMPLAV